MLTLKAEDCRSRALSLLMLRVARCGEDAVSVEAWLPWGDAAYDENASVHCYLTMESVEILVAAEVGMEE